MDAPPGAPDFVLPEPDSPWSSAAAGLPLLASAPDDFGRTDWAQWLPWDASAAPPVESKCVPTASGSVPPYAHLGQAKAPLYQRRHGSPLHDRPNDLQPTAMATAHPSDPGATFAFGNAARPPPAFPFAGSQLSSPAEGTPQNSFYSPAAWEQHNSRTSSLVSPTAVDPAAMAAAGPVPPRSTPSLHHSPGSNQQHTSPESAPSSEDSPPQSGGTTKKRKSSAMADMTPDPKAAPAPAVKKTSHNMIEKRYRTNLNDKIAALRDSVPSLRVISRVKGEGEDDDDEDLEGLTPAHKLNKATVLSKATEYIQHLENRNKRLALENGTLKARLDSYDKVALSAPMGLSRAASTPDGARFADDPFAAHGLVASPGAGPQGMIPVPENIANLHRAVPPQQHYAPQSGYATYTTTATAPGRPAMQSAHVNSRRTSGLMGKLMVGSLAGLMVLEGVSERRASSKDKEPAERELFALPAQIAGFGASRIGHGGPVLWMPLLKLALVLGAVFYLVAPFFEPRPKANKAARVALARAPSLASPVEVRRKAWLTAIQTVWVPRHNVVLEVAALALKTTKLGTRKLMGWPAYALVTGTTQEHEAARVRAWSIALDAQLTGGDAEISISRLLLTLLASGTLPDTPAALMLKALHIRVLLWEVAQAGYRTWFVFQALCAKLARRYWNLARNEHQLAVRAGAADPLPDHVAALLELECNDVLVGDVIQRAYNLAWNRSSPDKTTADAALDGVIEDFAICSPLDAVAAWWSTLVCNQALVCALSTAPAAAVPAAVVRGLDVAARTAPPTSNTHLRILVARAVVLDHERAAHLAAAVAALPPSSAAPVSPPSPSPLLSPGTKLINLVGDAPVAADVAKALALAKSRALAADAAAADAAGLQPAATAARARAAHVLAVHAAVLPQAAVSLLSAAAADRALRNAVADAALRARARPALERVAAALRIWAGRDAAARAGLRPPARRALISRCLDASFVLVGLPHPRRAAESCTPDHDLPDAEADDPPRIARLPDPKAAQAPAAAQNP